MKFVDIEELLKKYPNRYMAIVAAAKEARKIIEERKPVPITREDLTATPETAVVETDLSDSIEVNTPKKRGRKPKKAVADKVDIEKTTTKVNGIKDATDESSRLNATGDVNIVLKGRGVIAEKTESNPYIEALKRILK